MSAHTSPALLVRTARPSRRPFALTRRLRVLADRLAWAAMERAAAFIYWASGAR